MPAFKWKHAKNKKLQLAATLKKDAEARQQGKDYGAGIGINFRDEGNTDEEMVQQGMTTKGAKKRKTNTPSTQEQSTTEQPLTSAVSKKCRRCGSGSHSRSTKHNCLMHPMHPKYVGDSNAVAVPVQAEEVITAEL